MKTHSRHRRRSSSAYRHDGEHFLIELNLKNARQLFNSLDPAPFREKDLDPAAEEYIVSAVRELGFSQPARLLVHLPQTGFNDESDESIVKAIRHYFEYRAHHARDELRQTLSRGLLSLGIGLVFLFSCLWTRQLVGYLSSEQTRQILSEGLLIAGWVAMWRPIEVFLYDWWPLLHRERMMRRIGAMRIDVNSVHDREVDTGAARDT